MSFSRGSGRRGDRCTGIRIGRRARIFLDSNAILSGLLSDRGAPRVIVSRVVEGFQTLALLHLEEEARRRGERLLEVHRRFRAAARIRNLTCRVEPKLPPDVLRIYVYLPAKETGRV